MADDLRARIAALRRDMEKAIEIENTPKPDNHGIEFDATEFAKLFGYDGPQLTPADPVGTDGEAEPIELATFPFTEYAAMFRIQQLEAIRRREAEQPPAPASTEIVWHTERLEPKPETAPRAPRNAPLWMESGD